jgi:hypothetical protein
MRQMMEDVMAKVIEFYIPDCFPKKVSCMARTEPSEVIEFRLPRGKGVGDAVGEPAAGESHTKGSAIPMWTFRI